MRIQKTSVVVFLALLCCLLWGSAFPCIKIGYLWFHIEGAASQILFAGWRFFLSGIMTFVLFSLKNKKLLRIKRNSIKGIFGQGVLQTTVQYFFFYIGLASTTSAKGSVITASNAFFSIIIAHFLLKREKLTSRKVCGCIVGFIGVIIVNLTPGAWGTGFHFMGEGFVLLCAIAYGASTVTSKIISEKESPEAITAFQLLFGGGILVLMGYLGGGTMAGFTLKSACLFIYMALLSTIAFTIWAMLLKYNPVAKVAPFGFTIPVFATVLSGIFLQEDVFTLTNMTALFFVSVGILCINVEKRRMAMFNMHVYYIAEDKIAIHNFFNDVKEAGIIDKTRAESGNFKYDYYFSADRENAILLVEKWLDEEAQVVHDGLEHMEKLEAIKKRYGIKTTIEPIK